MGQHIIYAGGRTREQAEERLTRLISYQNPDVEISNMITTPIHAGNREWWEGKLLEGSEYVALCTATE